MSRWDIDPAGVRAVVTRTAGVAEAFQGQAETGVRQGGRAPPGGRRPHRRGRRGHAGPPGGRPERVAGRRRQGQRRRRPRAPARRRAGLPAHLPAAQPARHARAPRWVVPDGTVGHYDASAAGPCSGTGPGSRPQGPGRLSWRPASGWSCARTWRRWPPPPGASWSSPSGSGTLGRGGLARRRRRAGLHGPGRGAAGWVGRRRAGHRAVAAGRADRAGAQALAATVAVRAGRRA
jgi:hypothetical protein